MENLNIPNQLEHTLVKTVTRDDTANRYGSGLVEVFATPAMIAFMEQTCHSSIQAYLPSGYSSVGTEVNVKHLKATPVGDTVKCTAQLQFVEGRKLIFSVSVFDSKGLVGEGSHTRYIIDVQKFMAKLG
ncbi:MAG: fluoroacetyl-CoA thioesterase [Bacteroidales bacterium]|jgi:predicted thioesterase|nr:fluoroacetyl-CoA thioesterase [Bacteroidales bacterium]MDN5328388.1 fluoroacetyl-CoA thioesterase [Bacteroidales bacterium]